MLGVAFVKLRPHGQPEIREDNHPTEDVQSVESGDGEIAGEVRTVLGQKHVGVLDIFLLDIRDLLCVREGEEMRAIHERIGWIGIHRIECDLVFLRTLVMQMTTDLGSRRKSLLGEVAVPEKRLIFFERIFFDERPEVLKLLWPFIGQFHRQEDHAAQDRD